MPLSYDQVTPYVDRSNFTFEELIAQAISLYYRAGYYQRCGTHQFYVEDMERDYWQLLFEAYAPWTE